MKKLIDFKQNKSNLYYRHLELTVEDKEKLKGSLKVAKKLEKMEGKNT